MTKPEEDREDRADASAGQVGAKAARKLKARRNATPGVWFGLGMMGLIGWSVVVPTLLGAALGLWLDKRYPGRPFLDAGAAGGRACASAVSMPGIGSPRKTRPCGSEQEDDDE